MKPWLLAAAIAGLCAMPADAAPMQAVRAAIAADPAPGTEHPARMEVLHIPSGDVKINGVAYIPTGKGPHPTLILMHGLPGNEKNLDLAQAVRRAGWTVITFNYRGSWGSPGVFRFARTLGDARAVIAYARDPANATTLAIDPARLVIAGHSMGGWVAAMTAADDRNLAGAILISAANMGAMGRLARSELITISADRETLADVTPESLADDLIAQADAFDFTKGAARMTGLPLLVLSTDDGLAPDTDALVGAIRVAGGGKATTVHVATDHGWSGTRIRLQNEVIGWLEALPGE